MARYLATILILLSVALPSWAATNFIYPLAAWDVSTQHGEDIGSGLYHMGVDAGFNMPAGTPVYAVADGTVKEARERSQFGLVVLVEHDPDDEDKNVSLYGHLDPTQVLVSPGEHVSAGDIVGVLGTEENNGGWSVHIHFGIHKGAYTGDWVYYGHVYDADTANDWEDPETYIPNHLIADDWKPSIELDLADDTIVGNEADLTGTIGDIGSGVQKVRIKTSTNGTDYETIVLDEDPDYDFDHTLDLSDYPDGDLYLRIIARDHYNNKTVVTKHVTKDPYHYTTSAFVAMKSGRSDAFITQWSFGGTTLNAFFPFADDWSRGGLLAVGDVHGNDQPEVIALRRKQPDTTPLIKVLSGSGSVRHRFALPNTTPRAVAVGNGLIYVAQPLEAYSSNGSVAWSSAAISSDRTVTDLAVSDTTLYVCWTANNKSRLSFVDLASGAVTRIIRPLRKAASTGCQVALGDVTGDGTAELIVGSNGSSAGTVRLLTLSGEALGESFRPFGDGFTGKIDVSSMQWDTLEDSVVEDEVLVSQASNGQAWIKVYRLSNGTEIPAMDRVYEEEFTKGTSIVGWR